MRSIQKSQIYRVVTLIGFAFILALPTPASADSFVVNATDDADDGLCDASHCSLREAILAANNNPGPDTISFAGLVSSGGGLAIRISSPLPLILDDGTNIDGKTVQGYLNEPLIYILKDVPEIEEAFHIQSNNNNISGLTIAGFGISTSNQQFPDPQQYIGGNIVITGNSNTIWNNTIGMGATPSTVGIRLMGSNNVVLRNVISGNGAGIILQGPGQVVIGNMIGTGPGGVVPNGNGTGIYDLGSGGNHVIGDQGPGDGNVISGNNNTGMNLSSSNNTVQGNLIGVDATGTQALPNGGTGLAVTGDSNHIGGTYPGQGNVISGNQSHGIWMNDQNNVIQGNKIGTDINGTNIIPNGGAGIEVEGGPGIIGGASPGMGNVIMGNAYHGVYIDDYGGGYLVAGNTISHNDYAGIFVNQGLVENTFTQNSIFQNGGLGIEISYEANNEIEVPILQEGRGTTITGTACPNCMIELYKADPDPTGYGEGKEYLTDGYASSNGSFSIMVDDELFCTPITATATDADGNTSEFSQNIEANCIRLGPLYLIPIWTFTVVVFGALGVFVRRRNPNSSPWVIPGSLAVGFLVGGGLILLAGAQPNVIIGFKPEESVPYSGQTPSCDTYLDPAAFSPQDGETLPLSDDILLEWDVTDALPDGVVQWTIDLEQTGMTEGMESTEGTSIWMSAFGMAPVAGSSYEWSILGQHQLPDSEDWLPFCGPSSTLFFQIEGEESQEPPPAETPTPTEEALCTSPLITASMNLTCRKGPDQAYEEAGYLLQGETAVPEGVSMDTFWYWIPNPDWLGYCFVAGNGVQAECTDDLPPIAAPPLPTATSTQVACLPALDSSACDEAGGTFILGAVPICECP